ncbi:MAG: hypothetical protein WDZ76_07000 [Pseudohongiellaceae bacterium]
MYTILTRLRNPALLLTALLAACQPVRNVPERSEEARIESEQTTTVATEEVEDSAWEQEFQRQRIIGDLLYDALRAMDEDRLLTPADNNAHSRYQRVLAYDPDNALALEGVSNIVTRYIELAEDASRQGRFEAGLDYLERARFVDHDHPAIDPAWQTLQDEMNSSDLFFDLDRDELRRRSALIQEELANIAEQAREHEAFFLITAPSDAQARWIFGVMREAVEGYRLRGNIELGARATVRLRMPENTNLEARS